jgi:hypothetical protein
VDQEVEVIPAHIGADYIAVFDEIILQLGEEGDAVPDGCIGLHFIHPEGEGFFARADTVQGSHLEVFDIFEAEVRLGEAVFVARIAPIERLQEKERATNGRDHHLGFSSFCSQAEKMQVSREAEKLATAIMVKKSEKAARSVRGRVTPTWYSRLVRKRAPIIGSGA